MCCQLETPELVRLFCLLRVAAAPPPACLGDIQQPAAGLGCTSCCAGHLWECTQTGQQHSPAWVGTGRQGRDISRDTGSSSSSFVFQSSQERMFPLQAGLAAGQHSSTIPFVQHLWNCTGAACKGLCSCTSLTPPCREKSSGCADMREGRMF